MGATSARRASPTATRSESTSAPGTRSSTATCAASAERGSPTTARHLRTVHKEELAEKDYETEAEMVRELIENRPMEADVLDNLLAKKVKSEGAIVKEETSVQPEMKAKN